MADNKPIQKENQQDDDHRTGTQGSLSSEQPRGGGAGGESRGRNDNSSFSDDVEARKARMRSRAEDEQKAKRKEAADRLSQSVRSSGSRDSQSSSRRRGKRGTTRNNPDENKKKSRSPTRSRVTTPGAYSSSSASAPRKKKSRSPMRSARSPEDIQARKTRMSRRTREEQEAKKRARDSRGGVSPRRRREKEDEKAKRGTRVSRDHPSTNDERHRSRAAKLRIAEGDKEGAVAAKIAANQANEEDTIVIGHNKLTTIGLEAQVVNEDEDLELVKHEMEMDNKRRKREMEEENERLRQQIQEDNERYRQQMTLEEPRSKEEGRPFCTKKSVMIILIVVAAFAIGIGGYFGSGGSTPASDVDPTLAPSSVKSLYPSPSKSDCEAVAIGEEVEGQDEMDDQTLKVEFELITEENADVEAYLSNLEDDIQEKLMPLLVGCDKQERRLIDAGHMRGSRKLDSLPQNIIANGIVVELRAEPCNNGSNSQAACYTVTVIVKFFLQGDVEEIERLLEEHLEETFGNLELLQTIEQGEVFKLTFESVTSETGNPNPTLPPTQSPVTASPTENGATRNPTNSPTTKEPTTSPTLNPTRQPTNVPTPAPTLSPTCPDVITYFDKEKFNEEDGDTDASYDIDCGNDLDLLVLVKGESSCDFSCGLLPVSEYEDFCDNSDLGIFTVTLSGDNQDAEVLVGFLSEDAELECGEILTLITSAPTESPTKAPTPLPTTPAPTESPTYAQQREAVQDISSHTFTVQSVEELGKYFLIPASDFPVQILDTNPDNVWYKHKTTIRIKNHRTQVTKGVMAQYLPDTDQIKGYFNPAEYAQANDFQVGDLLDAVDYKSLLPGGPCPSRQEYGIIGVNTGLGWNVDSSNIRIGKFGVIGSWYANFEYTLYLDEPVSTLWTDAVGIVVKIQY